MNKYMDGLEYERFCAGWLKTHGYHNIRLTRTSGDQGIDILADKCGRKYGFQCKYYQTAVGNEAVQQVFSGAAFYHCNVACVITNNTFTKSAIALAEETDVLLYENVQPETFPVIHYIYVLFSLWLMCTGIFELVTESRKAEYSETELLIALCISLSGTFGMFSNHYSCALICFILSFLSLVSMLLKKQTGLPALFLLIYILLVLIRIIVLQKKKYILQNQTIRNEIENEIENSTEEFGNRLQDILSDEFHCDIKLQEARHINNQQLEFIFHANKNIQNDIALVEYSLNQYAGYHSDSTRYHMETKTPRIIYVQVTK